MAITTLSSREFNQDTGRAKQASRSGPVFITDRGRPAHVLITIEEYQKLTGGPMTWLMHWLSLRLQTSSSIRRRSRDGCPNLRIFPDVCA
jgi:prevent-host-death family protein